MSRRLFPVRPEKWEFEVFTIEKEPNQKKCLKYQFGNELTISVKELVENICEKIGILPVNKALFGLSSDVYGGSHYLPYSYSLTKDAFKKKLYFRIQFKVDFTRMHESDPKTFNYYLMQCRHDFIYGRFRENFFQITDDLKKQEMLLRMLILETLLVVKDESPGRKEKGSPLQQFIKRKHSVNIENILTKYVDDRGKNKKDEVKKCKKIIEKSLPMFESVTKPDLDFVREVGFLPEYANETFKNMKKVYGHQDVTAIDNIWLTIHPDEGIVRLRLIDGGFKKADEKTPFHNVGSLAVKKSEVGAADLPKFQLVIGKLRNQQTEVISSDSEEELLCICSWIDGYYRLLVDQYTCLLEDKAVLPSIHGPIERDVCIKLMESINCVDGDFVVRERRDRHKEFVLTVRVKGEYRHHEIHCIDKGSSNDKMYFIEQNRVFDTLEELIGYYQTKERPVRLERMIKPASTGPLPFCGGFKTMPILKRIIPSSITNEIQLLDSKSFIKKKELQKGHFGVVWECLQRKETTSKTVAVRFISAEEITQKGFERIYKCYREIMSSKIVRITGCSVSSESPKYFAFEFMDGGPLDLYLSVNRSTILYRTLLKFFMDIAEGMKYLEKELRLIHGNLNCHNVLRLANGDIKLSDGCFDPILQEENMLTKAHLDTSCNWRAPEVLMGEKITHQSDSWSYGMTLWEMMALSKPFGTVKSEDVIKAAEQKNLPSFAVLPYCPMQIQDILVSCWSLTPEYRNNFTEIYNRLDVYKRGAISDSLQTDANTEIKQCAFPVATHLLDRQYYNWEEVERIEQSCKEQEARELKEMKNKVWQDLAGSADSADSFGSGSGSIYGVKQETCSRNNGSSESVDLPKRGLLPFNAHIVGDHSISNLTADIEMTDLGKPRNIVGLTAHPSILLESPPAHLRSAMTINTESEVDDLMHSSNGYDGESYDENIGEDSTQKREPNSRGCSNGSLLASETQGVLSGPCQVDLSSELKSVTSNSCDDSNRKDENVTEDIMEVANVLASMAHHRTMDQKRPRGNDTKPISQKVARRFSPTPVSRSQEISNLSSLPEASGSQMQQSRQESDNIANEKLSIPFVDIDQNRIGTSLQNTVDQGMQVASQWPAVLSDSVFKERKKRSLSVSEELTRMQKRAARRALDIPNPFNIGTSTPKNFLMSFKAPLAASNQSQPEDISKYVSSLASKGSSVAMTPQETKSKSQEVDNYKRLWDVQQLDEKFHLLKADSPGNSVNSIEANPLVSGSPSLSYVTPSKQVISQVAGQTNITNNITAYVPNVGQPLVPGKSVIIPQLSVGAVPGQTLGNANILEVLQANERMRQLKPSDTSVQMATPECLQTLFAILTARNVQATSVANSYNLTPISALANVQSSHLLSTSAATRIISGTSHPPAGKTVETAKKIIDIKPRPAHSLIDKRQIDNDRMVPVQTSEQLLPIVTSPSITVMHELNDSKVQPTKPFYVKTAQDYRPLILDSISKVPRPLFIKQELSTHSNRAQQPIVSNTIPEQRGRTEKLKEDKCTRKPNISVSQQPNGCEVVRLFQHGFDSPGLDVKIESSYPTPYTTGVAPFHPVIHTQIEKQLSPLDKSTMSSVKLSKSHRRKPGDAQTKHVFFSQMGNLKIFRKEDLTVKGKLGEGQFGEVWKALLKFNGNGSIKQCPVAVKKLKADEHTPSSTIEEFKNEVKQMASLNSDHIVKLLGVSVDSPDDLSDPWIITELMPLGSLNQFIAKDRGTILEEILLTFAVQIAKGMEFLQSCRIVHRDLAARNVLVESRDRVKVSDFGLSRMFGEKDYYRSHNGNALIPVRWFAPESIKEQKFTAESDVWSYGVTIWEMFELWGSEKEFVTPYEDVKPGEILDFLTKGGRLTRPSKCSHKLWTITFGCWTYSPDERHSFYRLWDEIHRMLP